MTASSFDVRKAISNPKAGSSFPTPRKKNLRKARSSPSARVTGLTGGNADVTAGISIVLKALEAPIRQIAENAGVDGSIVIGKLTDGKDRNQGFDAQTESYVDMIKAGIVDPAKVVRTALQDAGSIAALLITAEAMIADIPPKDATPMGGMGY